MENVSSMREFENAVRNKNTEQQIAILKFAIEQKGFQSQEVSELIGAVANFNLPFITLMEAFCNANPNTPHMAEVRLADYYVSKNRMDDATARARQFLSKLRGSEGEKNPGAFPILLNLMARSYLLLTAAYTRLGARSYSQRILQKALELPLEENFVERIENEILTLKSELHDTNNLACDHQWEAFFNSGEHFVTLHAMCINNQCPQIAKRLEILNENFQESDTFQIDDSEILKDIFISKSKDSPDKLIYELH